MLPKGKCIRLLRSPPPEGRKVKDLLEGGAVEKDDYLSVKNQRFLPPPLQGEARVRRKTEARWRRGRFLRCFAATPHPSAALTPSPVGKALVQGGFAVGRCGDGKFCCDNPSVSFADSCLRATRSRLWLSTGQSFTTATALR